MVIERDTDFEDTSSSSDEEDIDMEEEVVETGGGEEKGEDETGEVGDGKAVCGEEGEESSQGLNPIPSCNAYTDYRVDVKV